MSNSKRISLNPSFNMRFCRLCGEHIPNDESALVINEKSICLGCISEIDTDDIVRLCELENKTDLLTKLGFRYDFS